MAISFNGANRIITLSTTTNWLFKDIYDAAQVWAALPENMKYVLPCSGAGKFPFGGGAYSDIIYSLLSNWKLRPSGYTTGTPIIIRGTIVTDDSTTRVSAPVTGGVPSWEFQVASYGTVSIVSGEGGSVGGDYTEQLDRMEGSIDEIKTTTNEIDVNVIEDLRLDNIQVTNLETPFITHSRVSGDVTTLPSYIERNVVQETVTYLDDSIVAEPISLTLEVVPTVIEVSLE